MSFDYTDCFTKENLDGYLKELAKEFRKLNGKTMPAEIILIGGAAILVNYGFRKMTTDVDAVIHAASSMKDAISRVGDKFNLPTGWLNADFKRTSSYTPRLEEFSVYYKTFSNVLEIRTISSEYLIAMKLRSGRKYKHDLSDIIGILNEHERRGKPISMNEIDAAVQNLYDGWDQINIDVRRFIESAISNGNYEEVYDSIKTEEKRTKNILIEFEQDYPGAATESNIEDVLQSLFNKRLK